MMVDYSSGSGDAGEKASGSQSSKNNGSGKVWWVGIQLCLLGSGLNS